MSPMECTRSAAARLRWSLALALAAAPAAAQASEETDWVVSARHVYTASGDPIDGGHVVVENGKIAAVGPGGARGGEQLEVEAVTPGLVDLSVRIDVGTASVEQSTEAAVVLDVADALDLFSHRWRRELESGVTTVLVAPLDDDVIGGFGAVLKTGGPPAIAARMVRPQAVLRASMGGQPSNGNFAPRGVPPLNFYARRPTTRMGVEWVFRKTFYDALAAAPGASEGDAVIRSVLSGDLPVFVQAWATQDIRTAVYLKEELGIPRLVVDAAAEAWREPALLVRSGTGVVLPPHSFEGRTGPDGAFFAWDTAAKLDELGVPLALSAHGARDPGDRLARQAGFAMRGGLPLDAALRAVTITPATMVGVQDRVGSIEVGKDADLVLWDGTPFQPTSRIVGVLLEGRLIVDPRPAAR